jgi:uncharacterized protein YoxC
MTTINNIQDLIQLLRDQPNWAAELRGILLSDELKDLPAAVRELAQAVRDFAERTGQRLAALESVTEALSERTQAVATKVDGLQTQMNALDTKVDALDAKVDGLHTQVEGLGTTTDTLTGNMNFLRGAEYERRAENRALHQTQTGMGFLQPRIVMGPRAGMQPVFSSVLARARANAGREQRTLPELTEQNNFLNADVIIADMGDPGTRERRSPPVAYALFEASITADGDDVQRAADRARTLAQTMSVPVTPAVIAESAPEPTVRQADAASVQVFLAPSR